MTGSITLLTDFGPGSVYVGQMHAVLARLAPGVPVLDLAHDLPPGDVEAAAYVLRRSLPHGPPGGVHIVVVDPGVGTTREILVARADGRLFLGPDNGVLAEVAETGEARRVTQTALFAERVSSTFHGRDIMAPVAAALAGGEAFEALGPPTEPFRRPFGPVREPACAGEAGDGAIVGRVLLVDRFGNLITNIPASELDGRPSGAGHLRVRIGAAFIDGLLRTFGDVAPGRALAYIGSGDHLEIAVNGGRATDLLRLGVGDGVRVEVSSS